MKDEYKEMVCRVRFIDGVIAKTYLSDVEIVRCKDCRFRDNELACTQFDAYTSAAGDLFMPPDWFYCGYGKRKEE